MPVNLTTIFQRQNRPIGAYSLVGLLGSGMPSSPPVTPVHHDDAVLASVQPRAHEPDSDRRNPHACLAVERAHLRRKVPV